MKLLTQKKCTFGNDKELVMSVSVSDNKKVMELTAIDDDLMIHFEFNSSKEVEELIEKLKEIKKIYLQ